MSNGGYRNDESPISPYDPSNSIKATHPALKPAGNGAKTRPPRRSSANGVVACRQCRARKIRCDSTRPGCDNCARRSSQCEYDAVPKRRGPDKRPGTRRRSCKKRPVEGEETPTVRKRRRTDTDDERSDGNDDIIHPSGEPSYHLSASPIPLVPNSALTINTEVSRDFFGPTSTVNLSPVGIASLPRSRYDAIGNAPYHGFPSSITRHPTTTQIQHHHSLPFPGVPSKDMVGRSS
ncbi:hypothetical protein BDM02DRAFT_1113700 [Thelephora ganbajun]|uniref:Uncharacterized protein n=1 Tax=Thelephora ganbajun TaxID=370292 RepID=A0ACB6ZWM6_THEGA|nr:hypothetical protein BDM02DRAFT_1113700 [Thelephora ganbajun]